MYWQKQKTNKPNNQPNVRKLDKMSGNVCFCCMWGFVFLQNKNKKSLSKSKPYIPPKMKEPVTLHGQSERFDFSRPPLKFTIYFQCHGLILEMGRNKLATICRVSLASEYLQPASICMRARESIFQVFGGGWDAPKNQGI